MKETLTDIAVLPQSETPLQINEIEKVMLEIDQADCPVLHHFGPGVYMREVVLPQGVFAVGHYQKKDHLNIMLSGKVAIVENDEVKVLTAPMIFTGKPGRKMGYVMETCAWLNVYNTNETNIDTLEATYLDKSEAWQGHEKEEKILRRALRDEDRKDFQSMLEEVGISAELVREQSVNEDDMIPLSDEWSSHVSVRESDIEGVGLFLSFPVNEEVMIAPARINDKRTPAGRYVNHSKKPNCKYIKSDNDIIYLVSLKGIQGCQGGNSGEELTVDYRQALSIHEVKSCQE